MLPYQSISEYDAPELEPVKDLYDNILSFLYGLYDEYASKWNSWINIAEAQSYRIAEGLEE